MLHFVTGDMFETPADIRVNTVNCVGVMGKGVALEFKKRYPEMFKDYQAKCKAGLIRPGDIHVWTGSVWIINFPTKKHWRDKSEYKYIEEGLLTLRNYMERYSRSGRLRVTIPALGCGNGGLDWVKVSEMIRHQLEDMQMDIFVFGPESSRRAK